MSILVATLCRERERLIRAGFILEGLSLSMNLMMDAELQCEFAQRGIPMFFNLPVTVVGDADDIIAWSIK